MLGFTTAIEQNTKGGITCLIIDSSYIMISKSCSLLTKSVMLLALDYEQRMKDRPNNKLRCFDWLFVIKMES